MNEFDGALGTLKTPASTQKNSWIHSLPHEWLRLEEREGNCDQLPSHLTPATGCPKCAAAWVLVRHVAFCSTCDLGRLAPGLDVLQIGHVEPPMAVRLECAGGHLVEFDGQLLTVFEMTPSMLTLGLMGLACLAFYDRGIVARTQ